MTQRLAKKDRRKLPKWCQLDVGELGAGFQRFFSLMFIPTGEIIQLDKRIFKQMVQSQRSEDMINQSLITIVSMVSRSLFPSTKTFQRLRSQSDGFAFKLSKVCAKIQAVSTQPPKLMESLENVVFVKDLVVWYFFGFWFTQMWRIGNLCGFLSMYLGKKVEKMVSVFSGELEYAHLLEDVVIQPSPQIRPY